MVSAVTSADIECRRGDITRQSDIDAVVNAANAELHPGGGVAGAIRHSSDHGENTAGDGDQASRREQIGHAASKVAPFWPCGVQDGWNPSAIDGQLPIP